MFIGLGKIKRNEVKLNGNGNLGWQRGGAHSKGL
jgi:hypothetical protein